MCMFPFLGLEFIKEIILFYLSLDFSHHPFHCQLVGTLILFTELNKITEQLQARGKGLCFCGRLYLILY